MLQISKLKLSDKLPLTCTRAGTCCHGKKVNLNPWELALLANAKKMETRAFRDQYCDFGGIRLRFDKEPKFNGKFACSQYKPDYGCSVHSGRPLACRLYPLGRRKQGEETVYIYQGKEFPCIEECPDVSNLPSISVAEYIEGQAAQNFEIVQDGYLEVMQNLAEGAFVLLLDSDLVKNGDKKTLKQWRALGLADPEDLSRRIGYEWIDRLMLPSIKANIEDPISFINQHNKDLQETIQRQFGDFEEIPSLSDSSCQLLGLALHLGRGLGADPKELSEHWIKTAKDNGALE